ncbi:GumC family protein [Aliiruegeria lutimaris]|uniref:Polysaccharide chain length determinant protein, PEP-CTERM locus subfamily n=1 Tax=Aliiruegeria lutimaris TaxID=571298 RepID=A0A1G9FYB7_9RHOB|nr:hypothetical protein [Aliiruegeria lutimaris]SDK93337.1 polysaccharide chain length determinant protein, PEP-CTERM locus subfamily [Aliiruegeria lutimaris]
MSEIKFYLDRFFRRFHWFLAVAVSISAIAIVVALTLPPAYESEVRMIVESNQIPDELARSTVETSAMEQLQIIEQRLMTRENLLRIANENFIVRGQQDMSADEIVRAMHTQTTLSRSSGRNQATVMTITFEAPSARATAGVLNSYLSVILEQSAEFRTERAVTTLEFFEQQVEHLEQDLDVKSQQILEFKNRNAEALPETLNFRMSEQTRLQDRLTRVEIDIADLNNQRTQLIRLDEAARQIGADPNKATIQLSPRQVRLSELHQDLSEARSVYSEDSAKVRHVKALIAQLEEDEQHESGETDAAAVAEQIETRESLMLNIQLADMDSKIATLEEQRGNIEAQLDANSASIERTPANVIALEALERDYKNIQTQYNEAVSNLSRANTGERIEFMSRGQRITVIEPPAVPVEPTKPDRKKLAVAGMGVGILAGLALVYLLEFMTRTPRRPEDIVARFDVMPIATIPYVRTRQQMVVDRGVRVLVILAILVGIPAAIWAVHEFYMPLDLVADKVMNRLGVRW